MENISKLIQSRFNLQEDEPKHKTNKFWIIASEVAKLTATSPNRWLRDAKRNEWAMNKAIIDFKEAINIRNREALFIFLLKKYKEKK